MTDLEAIEERLRHDALWRLADYAKPSFIADLDTLLTELKRLRSALGHIASFVCLEAGMDGMPVCPPDDPAHGCHTCIARHALQENEPPFVVKPIESGPVMKKEVVQPTDRN